MRPMSNAPTAATAAATSVWRTPTPYMFGGLTLLLALISVSLIVLACSNRRLRRRQQQEKAAELAVDAPPPDLRPKIAVILAGHDNPTCIATHVPVSDAV